MTARWLLVALLAAIGGCALAAGRSDLDDAGSAADAASTDAAGPPPPADGGLPGVTDPEYSHGRTDVAACFDGADNNFDSEADCDDASCLAGVSACCVGRGRAECCRATDEVSFAFEACTAGDLVVCHPGVLAFGESVPRLDSEVDGEPLSLITRGQEADGGALIGEPIDLRASAVRLTARIAAGPSSCAGCLDAIGFGLIDPDLSLAGTITPAIAVMISRTRGEASLVLSGQVLARWRVEDDLQHTYAIAVDPEGNLLVTMDGGLRVQSANVMLQGVARAVVYGRAPNRGPESPPSARLFSLTIARRACDMPSVVERDGATSVPAPEAPGEWAGGLTDIRGPDVIRYSDGLGSQTRMALEIDRQIFLARPGAGGFTLSSTLDRPALSTVPAEWAEGGASDPALRFERDRLILYFTAWTDLGVGRIAKVEAAAGEEVFDGTRAAVVLEPSGPYVSFAQPSFLETPAGTRLLASARLDTGETAIVLLAPDTSMAPQEQWRVVDELHRNGSAFGDFDRDEVASPAVVEAAGSHRVYFAGRRGTRWAIGMLVSPEGTNWRSLEGPVMTGTGRGFDALGVLDPEPVILGGELRVYFAGTDGARTRIGVALAPAPL